MLTKEIERHEYSEELNFALRAANRAGEFLRESCHTRNKVSSVTGRDIKIEEDILSERIIVDELKKSRYSILSEEAGDISGRENSSLKWIVDPLDGTYNYLRRIPFCAVSIALWKGEEPIFGVVDGFLLKETFVGIVGLGAWCNDCPIHCGTNDVLTDGVIATGFPAGFDFSHDAVGNVIRGAIAYKKIRMMGSAAMSLAYTAAGRIDVYREENIMLWDVAGGLAVLKAAGGTYLCDPTDSVHQYSVQAGNHKIIG